MKHLLLAAAAFIAAPAMAQTTGGTTGGTGGVSYLRRMLDVVLFPELWALRTDL